MAANENDGESGSTALPPALTAFADSPQGFVLGLILTPLFEGLEDIVVEGLETVNLLFVGDSRASTTGTLGLADIPLVLANAVIGVGKDVGQPALDGLSYIMTTSVKLGASLGPWGLVGSALLVVGVIWFYAASIRLGIAVALEAIPGGGAILERL